MVHFSAMNEEPTELLLAMLEQSKNDKVKNRVSPAFSDVQEAIAWLKKYR